jgi:ABC-type Fe3+-siderophore transport system permease subunit
MSSHSSKTRNTYILGVAILFFTFALSLKVGSVPDAEWSLIKELRLPRALLAMAIGMGLAVAGATLQALFSNPLCEPYTLGISSGAALGAVVGASLGLDLNLSGLALPALFGALIFSMVILGLSYRAGTTTLGLLLVGVMLSFLGSSLVALWMAFADANGIQGALFWLMGTLSRARFEGAVFSLAACSVLSTLIWLRWRELDALLLGEEGAAALGISVAPVRRRLIFLSSLLVGLCVSGGGMIGFVGLMIPHFLRKRLGSLHFGLLPACALWGASSLNLADTVARTVVRPYDLPVGVVTALVGAPLFVFFLLGESRVSRSGGKGHE